MLHGCAHAATSREAAFRIQKPVDTHRAARIIALDESATDVTSGLAEHHWQGARFLTCHGATEVSGNGSRPDPVLLTADGAEVRLSEALVDADVVVMIATGDDGAEIAAVIGETCDERRIMTAGLVIDTERRSRAAASALRPYAQVLLVSDDASDLVDLLSALRV